VGYLLASQVDLVANGNPLLGTLYLVLTYGVIGGGGIGVAYVCPIAALMKWFPDKKGTITGVAVATFGGGSFLIGYLETYLIILGTNLIGFSFLILGITYLLVVVVGSQLLSNPPLGWSPPSTPEPGAMGQKAGRDLGPGAMVRTRIFWLIWVMFILAPTAGLMTLSNVKSVAQAIDVAAASDPITWPIIAALILGIMALFNGAGRLFWGAVSDRLHRIKTLIAMFVILAGSQFAFAFLSLINTSWFIAISIAAITGFCFGGNFTLFPSMTAEFFGTNNVGVNWGVVSTAYGIAAVTGALVAGNIVDFTGSYFLAFMITGVLSLLAILIASLLYYATREK
jgi:OFA family oxalate/formate antiporter-like MFS transporter